MHFQMNTVGGKGLDALWSVKPNEREFVLEFVASL